MDLQIFNTYEEMKDYIGEICPSNNLFYSKDNYAIFSTNNIDGNFEKIVSERRANKPLKITANVDGYGLDWGKSGGNFSHIKLYYKKGEEDSWHYWNWYTSEGYTIELNKGEYIYVKGDNPNGFSNYTNNLYLLAKKVNEETTEENNFTIEGDIMALRGEYIFKPNEGDFKGLFNAAAPYKFNNLNLTKLNIDFETDKGHVYNIMFPTNAKLKLPFLPKKLTRGMLSNFIREADIYTTNISLFFEDADVLALQSAFWKNTQITNCYIYVPTLKDRVFRNLFKDATAITSLTLNFEDVDWTSEGSTTPFSGLLTNVTTTGTLYVPAEYVEDERILAELPATWTIKAIGE